MLYTYAQKCISICSGSRKTRSAAAIIYNNSKSQQQQHSRSIGKTKCINKIINQMHSQNLQRVVKPWQLYYQKIVWKSLNKSPYSPSVRLRLLKRPFVAVLTKFSSRITVCYGGEVCNASKASERSQRSQLDHTAVWCLLCCCNP